MPALTVASRLVGCLLLLGATAWAVSTPPFHPQTPPPAPATDLPPELAMVPPDTVALLYVPIDRIGTHLVMLNLLKRLPPEVAKNLGEQDYTHALPFESLGMKIPDLAHLTMFTNATGRQEPDAHFSTIFGLKQPPDRKQLLDKLLNQTEEKKAGGKSYYVAKEKDGRRTKVVHFIDDRRVLVPLELVTMDEKGMTRYFDRLYGKKSPGPLTEIIAQAKDKHLLLALNVTEGVRKEMERELRHLPDEFSWLEPVFQLQLGSLTMELGQVTQFTFRLRYADAAKAKDAEEGARHGLKVLLQQLEPILAEMQDRAKKAKGPDDLPQPALVLFVELQAMLKTGQVQVQDKELTVVLSFRTDDAIMEQFAKLLIANWKHQQKEKKRHREREELMQIFFAMENYDGINDRLPPHAIRDKNGKPLLSWRVAILPYVGEINLYGKFKLDEPWDSDHNKKLLARMPKLYRPPVEDKDKPYHTYYKVFVSPKGAKPASPFTGDEKITLAQINKQDGSINTILAVEGGEPVPWTKPEDIPFDMTKPLPTLALPFRDGINIVLCDGPVRKLKKGLPDKVLKEIITWNGGEKVDFSALLVEDE
jgi:hypothetical protein